MKSLLNRDEFKTAWESFNEGNWSENIDLRDFIQKTTSPTKETTTF